MNPKSIKSTLVLSLIVSSMLLFITGWYFISTMSSDTPIAGPDVFLLISVSIVAVGTMVLAIVVHHKKKLKLLNLKEDFKIAYESITQYLNTSNLSFSEKRLATIDLLDLFSDAADDQKSIEDIIGCDENKFMEDLVNAYGGKMSWLVYEITGLQYFLIYLLFIKGADNMNTITSVRTYLNSTVSYSSIFLFFIISFIVIPAVFISYKIAIQKNSTVLMLLSFIGYPIIAIGLFELLMKLFESQFKHIALISDLLYKNGTIFNSAWIGIVMFVVALSMFYVKKLLRINALKKDY